MFISDKWLCLMKCICAVLHKNTLFPNNKAIGSCAESIFNAYVFLLSLFANPYNHHIAGGVI